jgi:hypothetical protein
VAVDLAKILQEAHRIQAEDRREAARYNSTWIAIMLRMRQLDVDWRAENIELALAEKEFDRIWGVAVKLMD